MARAKKLRIDAAENRLRADATDALRLLVAGPHSVQDIIAFFAKHGAHVSLATASRTGARLREAGQRLLQRNATMQVIRESAAQAGVTPTQAALEQSAIAVGDILDGSCDPDSDEGKKLLLSGLTALASARSVEQRDQTIALKREEVALAVRRIQALEKKVADATQVVESKALTAEEQRKRLKEIFAK